MLAPWPRRPMITALAATNDASLRSFMVTRVPPNNVQLWTGPMSPFDRGIPGAFHEAPLPRYRGQIGPVVCLKAYGPSSTSFPLRTPSFRTRPHRFAHEIGAFSRSEYYSNVSRTRTRVLGPSYWGWLAPLGPPGGVRERGRYHLERDDGADSASEHAAGADARRGSTRVGEGDR